MQVALAGHRRPSAAEVEEEHERRRKRLCVQGAGIRWLRQVGERLRTLCVGCLVDFCQRSAFKRDDGEYARRVLHQARACGGRCWRRRGHCLRCLQPAHVAANCTVIEGVAAGRRRCCRRCFLVSVGGWTVHEGEEFGRDACPLENCTRLLMLCWSRQHLRQILVGAGCPVVREGGRPIENARQFADWVTKDNGSELAGVSIAMKWVHGKLSLSHFAV